MFVYVCKESLAIISRLPGIARTPFGLQPPPLFDTPPDTPEPQVYCPMQAGKVVADPRSPTLNVERTPIVAAECDVHRAWDLSMDLVDIDAGSCDP